MAINSTVKLVLSIAVCECAGVVGSIFTFPAIDSWYRSIIKPSFSPPNWIFGPVWTILFVLMGIALFLVWKKGFSTCESKIALSIFVGQLILNILWSILFFGMRNPGLAFIELIVLWLAILATIVTFAKISKPAAWLLTPYILWVSFAGLLNYAIWTLN